MDFFKVSDYFDGHFFIILPQKPTNCKSFMFNKQSSNKAMSDSFLSSKKRKQKDNYKTQQFQPEKSNQKFKNYFVQTKNIAYQQRPRLRKISQLNSLKWALILIWVLLSFCYYLIGRIQPYAGQCPSQATCRVFVHCPQHYQYKQQYNKCVLSKNYEHLIESISISQIAQLQYVYGDRQCSGEQQIPYAKLDSILLEIKDFENRTSYQRLLKSFLSKKQNQEAFGFEYSAKIVKPTRKLYSFRCRMQLFFSDPDRQFIVICIVVSLILITFAYRWHAQTQRITQMYEFLRQEVLEHNDQTLNVTHAILDLQAKFGEISEETWQEIDEMRASRKQFISFEKDFLYWKKR